MKRVGEYVRRQTGQPVCYLWVLENPPTDEDNLGGLNVHVLLHLPLSLFGKLEGKDGKALLKQWAVYAGLEHQQGVIDLRGLSRCLEPHSSDFLFKGVLRSARYLLKGIELNAAARYGISKVKDQGVICGERVGYSEALGKQYRWRLEECGRLPLAGPDLRYRRLLRHTCPDLLAPSQGAL